MSGENIQAFYEKVESDQDLQARLKTLADEQENATIAEVVKIAKAAGFEFTAGELVAFRAGRGGTSPTAALRSRMAPGMRNEKDCCYYAQACMPGFQGGEGAW